MSLVGKVLNLNIYPVKSLRGHAQSPLVVNADGPVGDREFVIVDNKGNFLSQRQHAAMATVVACRMDGHLVLRHHDHQVTIPVDGDEESPVTVWGQEVAAMHVHPDADEFLSKSLGLPVRLFRYQPSKPRVIAKPGQEPYETRFTDQGQVLLTCEESRQAVSKEAKENLHYLRFRPNIHVSGFPAWNEEGWKHLSVGEVEFEVLKACVRCKIITIDPDTGELGTPEALVALKNGVKGLQPKPEFGVYLRVVKPGMIRVGDIVQPS